MAFAYHTYLSHMSIFKPLLHVYLNIYGWLSWQFFFFFWNTHDNLIYSQWFLEKFLRWQDWYKTDPENDCSCWRNKNGRGKRCWRKRANKILKQNLIRNMEEKRIRKDKPPAAILNLWFRSVAGLTMSRKWENGDCVLHLWLCLVWGFKKKNGEGVEEKLTWP